MKRSESTVDNTRPWDPDKVRFVSDGPARPPWWKAQIDDPVYVRASEANFMRPDDYIIGLEHDGVRRAYPLWILDYYHIVNDGAGADPFVLFSCDRCQTGDAWLSRLGDRMLSFHFGGIHNCTLVGQDAQTGSKWLIADGVSIYGSLRGALLERVLTHHATYGEWVAAHPDTTVLQPPEDPAHRDKRHGHGGGEYYARAGISPLFPRTLGENADLRLPENEMVLVATHGSATRLYPITEVKKAGGVVHDTLGGESVVVFAGPAADSFWMTAHYANVGDRRLTFDNGIDAFVDRETRSRWRVDGVCLRGQFEGRRLQSLQFSFMRFHGWAWGHQHNDLYVYDGAPAPVDEGGFDSFLALLRTRQLDVSVQRSLINLERPNESVAGLFVRINGDRFRLMQFDAQESAMDYVVGSAHSVRAGLVVLESDPEPAARFADAMHCQLLPDDQVAWSKLLDTTNPAGAITRAALAEVFREVEPQPLGLTDLLQGLRKHGYSCEIGKAQTIDGLKTGRWIVETPRSCLRVGCRNAVFGKIEGNPFILYKFESDEAARRYLDEEKHASRIGRYVFRTTPNGMYYLTSGFGQLPDDQIPWSTFFDDKTFLTHVAEILASHSKVPKIKQYSGPPPMIIEPRHRYVARFRTEKGAFVAELSAKDAPLTVNNFVFLARDGYYNDTTFHMVQPGQYAQGGDPKGDGKGTPGYRTADEFSDNLRHDAPGVITTANLEAPDTNGSQFIILLSPMPHLDRRNTVFGRVTDGLEVVRSLTPRDSEWGWPDPPPGDRLITVEIEEIRDEKRG